MPFCNMGEECDRRASGVCYKCGCDSCSAHATYRKEAVGVMRTNGGHTARRRVRLCLRCAAPPATQEE